MSSSSRTKGPDDREGERQRGPKSVSCSSDEDCADSSRQPNGPARRIRLIQAKPSPSADP